MVITLPKLTGVTLFVTHVIIIKLWRSFHLRKINLCKGWLLIGVQLAAMFLHPLLDVGNDIIDIMVARYMPTMWLIFIGISGTELVDFFSEVDIWWTINIFRLLVLLKSLDTTGGLHDDLGSPRSYHKIVNTNQNIFPISLPWG